MFNATRPDGLDRWTMDVRQYELMREHILEMIDAFADEDGSIPLKVVVTAAQERYATHPLFPKVECATTAPSRRWTSRHAARSSGCRIVIAHPCPFEREAGPQPPGAR